MKTALPNPFQFNRQHEIDMVAMAAIADAVLTGEVEPDEPAPLFLRSPRPEYLSATELRPIVDILGRHAASC